MNRPLLKALHPGMAGKGAFKTARPNLAVIFVVPVCKPPSFGANRAAKSLGAARLS